jgi:type I restriction enzyme, R subunit
MNSLIPKLLSPKDEDLSIGILEAIHMDRYPVEMKETISIKFQD